MQSQVRFNRVPEKVLEKVPGSFGAKPSQVQHVLEGSGGGSGVQHISGEGSGEGSRKVWCKAKSGSTRSVEGSGEGLGGFGAEKVPEKVWEALVQRQVRFNRVPEKVPGEGSGEGSGEGVGGFGAEPGQGSTGFRRRFRRRFREALVQSQVRFKTRFRRRLWRRSGRLEMFLGLGFAARFRKICRNKMLRLLALGKPPKPIYKCF